jgi:hypothetical protein
MMYTRLMSFFYVHIGECNEQNILNLEFGLFRLNCNASTKQFIITDLFVKQKVI